MCNLRIPQALKRAKIIGSLQRWLEVPDDIGTGEFTDIGRVYYPKQAPETRSFNNFMIQLQLQLYPRKIQSFSR